MIGRSWEFRSAVAGIFALAVGACAPDATGVAEPGGEDQGLGAQSAAHASGGAVGSGTVLPEPENPRYRQRFRLNVRQLSESSFDVDLEYTDQRPLGVGMVWQLKGIHAGLLDAPFLYLEGEAARGIPGRLSFGTQPVCVWIEDGKPDRFHIQGDTVPPYMRRFSSAGAPLSCPNLPDSVPRLPAGDPGYEVVAGQIRVF